MSFTIQCPQCSSVLNVPDTAIGRRLRCPRCNTKMPPASSGPPTPMPKAGVPRLEDAVPSTSSMRARDQDDLLLPMSEGDLRETFDLPLMTEAAGAPAGAKAAAAGDALALFKDDGVPVAPRRRRDPAAGRATARRCPTCGGVVPQGMSLCQSCGLDLDTGNRVDLMDDLVPVSGPVRPATTPIGILMIGGLSFFASVGLGLAALIMSVKRPDAALGFQSLSLICAFGIYAAVQFLRSKSVKLLAIALTMGAVVAVIGLIAMPILDAQVFSEVVVDTSKLNDDETGVLPPLTERFPLNKVSWGIALLLSYAAVSVYLNSPPVRRHFSR